MQVERSQRCFNCDAFMVENDHRFWVCPECGDMYDEDYPAGQDLEPNIPDLRVVQDCPICGCVMRRSNVWPHDRWCCTMCDNIEDD